MGQLKNLEIKIQELIKSTREQTIELLEINDALERKLLVEKTISRCMKKLYGGKNDNLSNQRCSRNRE